MIILKLSLKILCFLEIPELKLLISIIAISSFEYWHLDPQRIEILSILHVLILIAKPNSCNFVNLTELHICVWKPLIMYAKILELGNIIWFLHTLD